MKATRCKIFSVRRSLGGGIWHGGCSTLCVAPIRPDRLAGGPAALRNFRYGDFKMVRFPTLIAAAFAVCIICEGSSSPPRLGRSSNKRMEGGRSEDAVRLIRVSGDQFCEETNSFRLSQQGERARRCDLSQGRAASEGNNSRNLSRALRHCRDQAGSLP